ncbi:MAG: hypothetical protein ACTSU0_00565 [Alphaproteobacteria bacterium]
MTSLKTISLAVLCDSFRFIPSMMILVREAQGECCRDPQFRERAVDVLENFAQ